MPMPIEHTGSVGAAAQLPPALLGLKKPFAAPTRPLPRQNAKKTIPIVASLLCSIRSSA